MKTKQDEIEEMVKAITQRNRNIEWSLASNDGDYRFPWWVKIPLAWVWLVMLYIVISVTIDIFNSIFK
jgi:hypothetical protein